MKFWSTFDDRGFLSRFQAFWDRLKAVEATYDYLSLDPSRRYWMDTYPPLTVWRDGRELRPKDTGLTLETISRDTRESIFSLYFHIGFCRRRCTYCRQYKVHTTRDPAGSELLGQYVDRLKKDIDISVDLFPTLRTRTRDLYFGGGTPSILPPRLLGSLLKHLLERVDLSILSPNATFELNPEDDVDDLLKLLQIIEIPRISIGVQSFDEGILHTLGRRYSRDDIFRMIDTVAGYGFKTVNLDLINGFPPHEEFANWKQEVECLEPLFESGAIHSATLYLLHPFPGTALSCRPSDAYWQIRNLCFAREYLCDRLGLNEKPVFWFQKGPTETEEALAPTFAVFGFGNSSYSALGRWLLQNESDLPAFMAHPRDPRAESALPIHRVYRLSPEQVQIRALLFAIRSGAFKLRQADFALLGSHMKHELNRFLQEGLLEQHQHEYRLTPTGRIFAHQMPIGFFDPASKKSLQDHLEARFSSFADCHDR